MDQPAESVPGVLTVTEVRARWMGHRLLAQVRLSVDGALSVARSHEIAEVAHHELLHDISNLSDAVIHVDPAGVKVDPHASTAHHRSSSQESGSRRHVAHLTRTENLLERRRPSEKLDLMTEMADRSRHARLLSRGRKLESATLGWNVVGVMVLTFAALHARSVALAGFGLDSLIEIGASTVVLWELADVSQERQRRAMRIIGFAFVGLALYLSIQSTLVLIVGFRPHHSPIGIAWTAVTAGVMFGLALGKARTGAALANPVLIAEGRITMIDGILATAVLIGLILNAVAGWWWADPLAGYVLLYYAIREARESLGH